MKNLIIILLVIFVVLIGCESDKQGSQIKREKEISVGKDSVVQMTLTQDQKARIAELQEKFDVKKSCPGPFPAPIVVSVSGKWKRGSSMPTLLTYEHTVTNEGNAWIGNSTFLTPCSGLYFFTISFVTDSYYPAVGTLDDVAVKLFRNSNLVGEAWAGEYWPTHIQGTQRMDRRTGVYSVALRLNAGDVIQTYVNSDGPQNQQYPWTIASHYFTGFRIGN